MERGPATSRRPPSWRGSILTAGHGEIVSRPARISAAVPGANAGSCPHARQQPPTAAGGWQPLVRDPTARHRTRCRRPGWRHRRRPGAGRHHDDGKYSGQAAALRRSRRPGAVPRPAHCRAPSAPSPDLLSGPVTTLAAASRIITPADRTPADRGGTPARAFTAPRNHPWLGLLIGSEPAGRAALAWRAGRSRCTW
jgi:hypothetical protein